GTAAGYRWGLPWGAKVLAPHVPVSAMRPISDEAMEFLDKKWFQPSRLSEERRQKLQDGFRALAAADPLLAAYGDRLSLNFRASPKLGPNALALPDGQIVLLDELVNLEMNDEEILAVLCHELGHLSKRHSIRLLIQSSVVGLVTAGLFGDVSYIAATVGAVLLSSNYSRDMEIEADDYAADTLRVQGKSPALLAAALEKLDAFHRAAARKDDEDSKEYPDWFSSHPASTERIRRLQGD
ncbi:MAG: M48 family metallopeptidase, partial [Azoarcus sp.]|nr:M48 family metallopeptidase [Azoarcus sp.]